MYDRLIAITYLFAALDLAGATADQAIAVPVGARFAKVLDVQAVLTEAVVGTTSPAILNVGTSANASLMATLSIPNGAAIGSVHNSRSAGFSHNGVYQADAEGSEQDTLLLSITDPTGGTPAGTANVSIVIGYDQANPLLG